MTDAVRIHRALLSVSDKRGLPELARALHDLGVELISTGGTARALADAGLPVTPVSTVTGSPEMLDGRVKTLHPRIHGAILARATDEHRAQLARHGIAPIDLVCVNLYPFERTIADPSNDYDAAIEQIDIGGPTMVRAAAKNHERVAILTDPDDYPRIIEELRAAGGSLSKITRRTLAGRALAHTAAYDAAIADYLAARLEPEAPMPSRFGLVGQRLHPLRYGENPHQPAAVYRVGPAHAPGSLVDAQQLHGKELSFNNLVDAAAAMGVVARLAALPSGTRRVAAAVIKHTNPCGAAVAPDAGAAVEHAIAGDPLAAFGGIIAVGAPIDARAAEVLTAPDRFLEVVIAPAFEDDALAMLCARWKTVRLLAVPGLGEAPAGGSGHQTPAVRLRQIPGGFVAQHADAMPATPSAWEHRAGPVPDPSELELAAFAEACAASLTSNAIAICARDGDALRLVGGGAGQMDRVTACRLAIEKAGERARGAVAASDAFFPFDDGPRRLIDAGVRAIVHPGGSRRDSDTFTLCAEHGVTCLVTGVRRFRH